MSIPSIVISLGLIGVGLPAWLSSARTLVTNPELEVPLNPMGICRSPYGEVFAMAMQSPIESYWESGTGGHPSHDHDHDHDHAHDEEGNCQAEKIEKNPTLREQLFNLINVMDKAAKTRTNPKPANESLMRHLRQEAENKLRFAYKLDPSHYGNYNSLHFFLTEPQIGTRQQSNAYAAKLAEDTIDYCLKQQNDPRPSLTAAAACNNILIMIFMDRTENKTPMFTTEQARQCLNLLDYCLTRYHTIAKQWDESKNWELLSPMRISECETRLRFISKIRDAAEKTVLRYESEDKISK